MSWPVTRGETSIHLLLEDGQLDYLWGATVPCLNEFVLDAFPVTLLTGASQLHSGLVHFQFLFLAIFERTPRVRELSQWPEGDEESPDINVLS
jgi:hypothetical protein